jgi:hypothetical protein
VKQIVTLQQALRNASTRTITDGALRQTYAAACSILRLLTDFKEPEASVSAMEHSICLTAQFVNVAFVSYMQGHYGEFGFFFLDHKLIGMTLCGTGHHHGQEHSICVSSERFLALDGMLGSHPVVVSDLAPAIHPSNCYDVLASAVICWTPGVRDTSLRIGRSLMNRRP